MDIKTLHKIKWDDIGKYMMMPVLVIANNTNIIMKDGYKILNGYKNYENDIYVLFTDEDRWISLDGIELYDIGFTAINKEISKNKE